MEIVQKYTLGSHEVLKLFNTLPPSIEPRHGHILEQTEMIKEILLPASLRGERASLFRRGNSRERLRRADQPETEDLLEGTREWTG